MGEGVATALVTGGTGAIGRAIGDALHAAGYRVVLAAPDCAEAPPTTLPAGMAWRALDVTDTASIDRALAGIEGLTVLVNAAGVTLREGREFDPDSFAQVVDINLTGAMRMCVATKPLLAAAAGDAGSAIVNVCSMLSFFGSPTVPAYAASKGGLLLLTKSLAGAWAADGIRVNAVAPGYIETDLTRPLHDDPAHRDRIVRRTPMGRWGRPNEVAGTVAFLCSAAAGFMTGTVLVADGGYSAI